MNIIIAGAGDFKHIYPLSLPDSVIVIAGEERKPRGIKLAESHVIKAYSHDNYFMPKVKPAKHHNRKYGHKRKNKQQRKSRKINRKNK